MDEVISTSRRTLVRGAAWSVPVIAATTAAPAFAASPCPAVTLSWASLGNGTTFSSTTVGGVLVTLTVSGQTGAANNRTVSTTQTGGQTSNLRFYSTNALNSSQTATISFTRDGQPVSVLNLAFSFLDIDSGGTAWNDNVSVATGGFAYVIANTTYVRGAGTTANAFRANGNDTSSSTQGTSTNGNVAVSWSSAVSSVSFTYAQSLAATGSPFIGISNLSFQPVIC
ncbi:hypothetical protein KDN32_01750 [Nocardioides sp. J2M5]|uniref:hypothetical protein n=1 Tax=Nocardioides palaemonis TaxID=2829810 RepID=UPI001BAA0A30|nr:hypothetical protein [Nocardioides palaemonis]MBS2936462.1 hypothetical protein [Nocardioides palaemonis]